MDQNLVNLGEAYRLDTKYILNSKKCIDQEFN